MTAHMTNEQRQLARRLQASGRSLRDITKEVGMSHGGIRAMLRGPRREARPDIWAPARARRQLEARVAAGLGVFRRASRYSVTTWARVLYPYQAAMWRVPGTKREMGSMDPSVTPTSFTVTGAAPLHSSTPVPTSRSLREAKKPQRGRFVAPPIALVRSTP